MTERPEPAPDEYGSWCGHSIPPGLRGPASAALLPTRVGAGYRYPDVSVYRPVVDWGAFADAYPVAFCKTSEGLRTDPTWHEFLAGCRRRGVLPGGYHFLRAEWSAEAQARYFLSQLDGGPVGIMLDVEASAVGTNPTVGRASRWCTTVSELTGRPRAQMLGYVPRWWWLAHGAGLTSLSDLMAVNSDYRASPSTTSYAGFPNISVIQYSDSAPIAGVRTPGDMNVALGMDAARFAAALGCPLQQEGEDVTEQDKIDIANRVLAALRAQVFDVTPPIRQGNAGQVIGATYNKVGDVQSALSAVTAQVAAVETRAGDGADRIDFLYGQLARFAEPLGVVLDPPPWRTP